MAVTTTNPRPSIEALGLSVGYGPNTPVLRDLTFSLHEAGIVRLDAKNGRGKSTLIEAASGYLRPSAGRILINGQDAHAPQVRQTRRICRAMPALHPHLSLVDHLALSADLAAVPREDVIRRAKNFGLEEWFGSRTSALSTGTSRKLWYVVCTTGHFSVALLDEPFNGVDQQSVVQMAAEMNKWSRQALIVLVSHAVPSCLNVRSKLTLHDPVEARST